MQRTTIVLPEHLKAQVFQFARLHGISFGEFVRASLKKNLLSVAESPSEDPFFKDCGFFKGAVPKELSQKHDTYLYGDKS